MRYYDLVVIGGGPAGLMAAGKAASLGKSVLLLEKMEKPARKLRITGKGRCNITNTRTGDEFLEKVRCNRDFFAVALRKFTTENTIKFFEDNGLRLITERGDRVFPASGKAWDVADTLITWAKSMGAEIECFSEVARIEATKNQISGVVVKKESKTETIGTKNVVIATGGVSYPSTGSTGDGYDFAYTLGHEIVEVRPSLVPLEIDEQYCSTLDGLLLKNVNVRLFVDGSQVDEKFGELEFFEYGIGGAVTLQLSRDAIDALIDEREVEISIDLKPALSEAKLKGRFSREIPELPSGANLKDLIRKMLPKNLVAPILRNSGLKGEIKAANISDTQIDNIIKTLKNFKIKISDYRPFSEAIVTAGGVDVTQIDPETLQSHLVGGLYFAGELLDLDANTGGYNLQIAFSTGQLAGSLLGER